MNKTGVGVNGFTVKAYQGDAKTLLAFNLSKPAATNLAGFTLQYTPKGGVSYYCFNNLVFKNPAKHAQVASEPARSSINSPIHKFRWVHVPGSAHQGLAPYWGTYTYEVTPRYFDDKSLLPLDPALTVKVAIEVMPFKTKGLQVGFTRGFVQSQAFVNHFGLKAKIAPPGKPLVFDRTQPAGINAEGVTYSYEDEWEWLGLTARDRILETLGEVLKRPKLRADVFAYDLSSPDVAELLIDLAKAGRIRIILDNADLHHDTQKPEAEDEFEKLFAQHAKPGAEIKRGNYDRYAHHKVIIVRDGTGPKKVLTGSTNFAVTGICVNSNHVIVFDDRSVAKAYADVFDHAWSSDVSASKFRSNPLSTTTHSFYSPATPQTEITFSPHSPADAKKVLGVVIKRIEAEATKPSHRNVMFAVMSLGKKSSGELIPALRAIHKDDTVFSYGISDEPEGIELYKPGTKTGVRVTGKPGKLKLPAPFHQLKSVGLGHQIHHKFVVCGFNGDDPVVYCGSSNLALGGEQDNGDNLIAIHDADVATAFAIEALLLVDHFEFLSRLAEEQGTATATVTATPAADAAKAEWFLSTTDRWVKPYFDGSDLKSVDRELFA